MRLTAEISLYPLNQDYIPIIVDFIEHLRRHDDLVVVTNAMSTQVRGDYQRVFDVLAAELRGSFERWSRQVLVCKFIVGDLPIENPPTGA